MNPNNQKPSLEDTNNATVPEENSDQGTSNANRETTSADGSTISVSSDDDWPYALNEYMENFQAIENDHIDQGNRLDTSADTSSDSSLKVHVGSQSSLNLELILANNYGQEVNASGASTSKNGNAKENIPPSDNSSDADDSPELL